MKFTLLKSALGLWLLLFTLANLAACGFHLRGTADIPFKSILIQGNTLVISKNLKQTFLTNKVAIVNSAQDAELMLDLIGEENEKRILSLASSGTVNEFELYYRVHYRSKLIGQETWSQVQTIEQRRDFTYSDAQILAKQTEEKRLNKSMQQSAVNSMIRRLSALKKYAQ